MEDLLFELNEDYSTTLVLVAHDLDLAKRCGRVVKMKGGKIIDDSTGSGE